MLLLHFTFASGIGVGHAGCAEFFFLTEFFLLFPSAVSGQQCQVQEAGSAGQSRERVCE